MFSSVWELRLGLFFEFIRGSLFLCLNTLFHSREEEVGRGFKFLSSGRSCWLFPIRNLYKQDVQEGSLQQFLAHQIFFVFSFFFFLAKLFFFFFPFSQLLCLPLLYFSALFVSLQLCRSAAVLPAAVPLSPWVPKAVGREDTGYHGGYKKTRCAMLPHQKGPSDLSKPFS